MEIQVAMVTVAQYERAYEALVDHNCGGKCPCEDCKENREIVRQYQLQEAAEGMT